MAKTGNDYVAVKVGEPFAAWRDAVLAFTDELDSDAGRSAAVMAKTKNFFSALGSESIVCTVGSVIR